MSTDKKVALIKAPFALGQKQQGVDTGPEKIIAYGLPDMLSQMGWEVTLDETPAPAQIARSDDAPIGRLLNPRAVSAAAKRVSDVVYKYAKEGVLPLTLGGDHSLAMGTVSGSFAARPDSCLIWVDAHPDIQTPLTTESGNMHGTPISFLLGIAGQIEGFEWVKPCLKPERIAYIGLRDVDAAERTILKEHNIKCFSMHEIDKYGIGKVVDMALDAVNPTRTRPIHLSFDIDSCDPLIAPSTGTPVRGGLTFREAHYICEEIAATGLLSALDMMEVNPGLLSAVDQEQTISLGCSIIRASLGETLI